MQKQGRAKTITILLCLSLLLSLNFSLQTNAATITKDVTSQVVELGNPFTKATFAKNVWDMQVFNGHIYLAHGDFNTNAGPIPVIYFEPATNKFVTQYTVNEEEINQYKVLNGKLYIPGTDAKDDWNFGNFYTLENNDQWTKHRTIPNANHVFDMAYFNGQLYAATGTTKTGWGEVLTSNDMGQTWSTQIPQGTAIFPGSWATTLFDVDNKLYAADKMYSPSTYTVSQLAKYMNILTMTDTGSVVQPYTNSFTQGGSSTFTYYLARPTKFNNYLVFLSNPVVTAHGLSDSMYAATSLTKSRKVVFPESTAKPSDLLVRDKTIYVLTNVKNSTNSYTNIVYQSTDLQTWTEVFCFDSDTFARSFEELNGDFYFGLGCDTTYLPASTGNILKVPEAAYNPTSTVSETSSPIIVDNNDNCFTSNSTWIPATVTTGFYGVNYLHDGTSEADQEKWAMWTPTITDPSNYNIYMKWTAGTDRPAAAPLEIKYNGGADSTKTANQQINNDDWVLIGTYNLSAGNTNYVKILCSSPGYTVADAVKFEKVSN